MESRKGSKTRSSTLPVDYLRLVADVFNTNFQEGLEALAKHAHSKAWFEASGHVYPDEVLLCLSVFIKDKLSATSVYASCDFDPKASSPTLEDILKSCVDAIGLLYSQLLDPAQAEQIERLAEDSLSALENVPFEWTAVQADRRTVFLRIDKANPNLDQMADQWLAQHDPNYQKRAQEEEKQTEDLFITGDRAKKGTPDSESGRGGGMGNGNFH